MVPPEFIEIYGIRIDQKEAALLEIVMQHKLYEFRNRAMKQLEQQASPETLKYIINNHKSYEFRNRAMKAMERL